MKFIINSSASGKSYLIEPNKDEIQQLLVDYITTNSHETLTIREFIPDKDMAELFRIYTERVKT
jgi:hypothetical protein